MASAHHELEKKLQDSNATPMSLPLYFLRAITCDFSTELELGRGGFGVVYKGVLGSGKIIAVKKLFEIHLLDDKRFQNEVNYLMEIKHQNIVQLIGYCAESSWEIIKQPSGNFIWAEIPKRLLCFEYICNESLDKYISDESSGLEWNMRYEMIKGISTGLHFLHEKCHIVHLDLKPENILMDSTMIPKISDFGLSKIFGSQQSRIITNYRTGTRGYMAPEYLIQGIVSMKADIFSLGVIILEIITGHKDYPLSTLPQCHLDSPQSIDMSFQHYIGKVLGSWRDKFVTLKYQSMGKYTHQIKKCITIALKCVDPVMEKRPTADDIIQVFNAVDELEIHEELPLDLHCKSNLLLSGLNTDDQSNQEAAETSTEPQSTSDTTTEVILWMDLHCTGCSRKVMKCIKHLPGVESVVADVAASRVVVAGTPDAATIKSRIEAKLRKPVRIVSYGAGPNP